VAIARSEWKLTDGGNEIASRGKRTVREALLSTMVEKIVSGELPEGSTLPNEADLTDQFGVSRTSLREAMQYLSAIGMVRSRTRAGTTVLPRENWSYLDPLLLDVMFALKAGSNVRPANKDAVIVSHTNTGSNAGRAELNTHQGYDL
jgi:DNA-binding transcriptional MocR family regulator